MTDKKWVSTTECAEILGVAKQTLHVWASKGRYADRLPVYHIEGTKGRTTNFYLLDDVNNFFVLKKNNDEQD
jgi:hypothetical protein